MADLGYPLLTTAILAPLLGGGLAWFDRSSRRLRATAAGSTAVSLVCSLEGLRELLMTEASRLSEPWLYGDLLSTFFMALFSFLAVTTFLVMPQRDLDRRTAAGLLLVVSATLTGYAAGNLFLVWVGWTISALPVLIPRPRSSMPLSRAVLGASAIALGIAVAMIGLHASNHGGKWSLSIDDLHNTAPGGVWAFAGLMIAVALRKGAFPAHSWVVQAFDRAPMASSSLLINGHLGAFLVLRLAIPLYPETARDALPILTNLALATAAYAAFIALAEREPRRLLGMVCVSQAALILAGLESGTREAVTGALVLWVVVAIATTGLVGVYRAVEARAGGELPGGRFLGLGSALPRFAVFFAVCGLALVGLPGTLGFVAEDLLFHGTLTSHPHLGVILPVATALNACHIFRLFGQLFLGGRNQSLGGVPDALPRERWCLAACVVVLVLTGVAPSKLVRLHATTARISEAIVRFVPAR